MKLKFKFEENKLTVLLSGEIDHHTAAFARNEIDVNIKKFIPGELCLDFSEVSFMDSSGVGLVMGRYKEMKKYSGRLSIANAPERIYKVMKLAGLEKLAEINRKGA